MKIDDTSLWQTFLDGNKQSFETIYTLYYKNLYEYGMRRLDNEDQVKDCIQELFIRLWTSRRNLSPNVNIKYYLLASMKHRLIDLAGTLSEKPLEQIEEQFRMDFTIDSEYIRREQYGHQAKQLIAALDQLTARQKEVIYLRYFEELSYEAIAEMMDISVKGAYKLSYRALDALKQLLNISRKDLLLLLLLCKIGS